MSIFVAYWVTFAALKAKITSEPGPIANSNDFKTTIN